MPMNLNDSTAVTVLFMMVSAGGGGGGGRVKLQDVKTAPDSQLLNLLVFKQTRHHPE